MKITFDLDDALVLSAVRAGLESLDPSVGRVAAGWDPAAFLAAGAAVTGRGKSRRIDAGTVADALSVMGADHPDLFACLLMPGQQWYDTACRTLIAICLKPAKGRRPAPHGGKA